MTLRMKRLKQQFIEELTQIFRVELKDSRLQDGFFTLSDMEITSDLSIAKIYISILKGNQYEIMEALNHSAGFMRTLLGKRLHIRRIPKMTFLLDISFERGARLEEKINKLELDHE